MKIFKKLIRDKIPGIIEATGERPVVRILNHKDYKKALENKLLEEIQEFRADPTSKDEIADIYEVLDALIKENSWLKEEIIKIQEAKRETRGGFEKKLFLEGTEK